MRPYDRRKPLRINYPDYHPPKGYVNWWEDIDSQTKSATRQKAKQEINNELNQLEQSTKKATNNA